MTSVVGDAAGRRRSVGRKRHRRHDTTGPGTLALPSPSSSATLASSDPVSRGGNTAGMLGVVHNLYYNLP